MEPDVLIIGSGIAGIATALRLAEDGQREILVITRASAPEESNTRYAQGGIVARGSDDSSDLLVEDILAAGAGLSLPAAAQVLAEEGPALVQQVLMDSAGVQFDRSDGGDLSYTREARHSANRILHVGDATGLAIAKGMIKRVQALPNVTLRTRATLVDLITSSHHARTPLAEYEPTTCLGAYVLDRDKGEILPVFAKATVLAAGGLGRIYRYSTNPEGARGDGLAAAYRAGARVINCEYIQFHPTTLAVPGADNFLISESVRGEGARLYTPDGRHFMSERAPEWGDLAPRDVVARAIHLEMVTHGYEHVFLDIASHMEPDRIRERFPTIYKTCREAGIDITSDPIPVVPAAHYFCGGVQVDEWGRTTVKGLYAVGEVSCTGLHGANRLASTSLLEGLVWGDRAARDIVGRDDLGIRYKDDVPPWQPAGNKEDPDPVLIYHDRRTIQNTMWLYVGLARSRRRLDRAQRELNHLWVMIDDFYRTAQLNDDLIGLRNMAQAARIVTAAASTNRTSRGSHYREDAVVDEVADFFNEDPPRVNGGSEF